MTKVVSCVRGWGFGELPGRQRGGSLPCGGCQRFKSAYLQLANLAIQSYMMAPKFSDSAKSKVWPKNKMSIKLT